MEEKKNILVDKVNKKPRKESNIGKAAHSIIDGSFLTREKIIRSIPFLFYLTLLVILYIANSYFAEKTWLEIDKLKKDLKELRYQYISSKSRLMSISMQSEIARRLESTGVRESVTPPKKLLKQKEH